MKPLFFKTPADFRKWLEIHHETQTEVFVGFHKVKSGKTSMTWSESVDQALCFGWIDGIRRSIDHESYCNRFTPRKKNSFWSAINIKKIEDLSAKGLMTPLGLKAFSYRNESNSYNSTDKTENLLKNEYLEQFKNNSIAWELFEQQAPSYKRLTIHWIMSAKKEETQLRRLYKTIEESEQGKRVKLFG